MISTHILDTSQGLAAAGVAVVLEILIGKEWIPVSQGKTNADGRWVSDCEKKAGTYRLFFKIEDYFKSSAREHFFLDTPVLFKVTDLGRKYHVPLLLNPFGYSTYRGT